MTDLLDRFHAAPDPWRLPLAAGVLLLLVPLAVLAAWCRWGRAEV